MKGYNCGYAKALRETQKALLVDLDGEEVWVPKSQIHEDSEVWSTDEDQDEGDLVVAEWWAEKEGWL